MLFSHIGGYSIGFIIGVRFAEVEKDILFRSRQAGLQLDDKVIVETARGVEFGEVVLAPRGRRKARSQSR